MRAGVVWLVCGSLILLFSRGCMRCCFGAGLHDKSEAGEDEMV